MMMHGGNWAWGGSTLMAVALVVFGALLITAVVLNVRYLVSSRDTGSAEDAGPSTAERLLAERYSRGDIDEDEYQHKLTRLLKHR
ncbi:SHOCT domain-containing protein [Mycobacterium sp.]|jgi:putative membrane protein|uniref:SHOCT domain-containing protein n=1 Tax=Mycobacterium sp. TaxID=1785 RepID=UPI0025CFD367|nr:SHOCT domain-containing protein [Mycobacterium sp.]